MQGEAVADRSDPVQAATSIDLRSASPTFRNSTLLFAIRRAGFYCADVVSAHESADGVWRISRTGYRRTYEAMFSIDVRGGKRGALEFLRTLKIAKGAVSLGGVETLACHPASTTHSGVPAAELSRYGVTEALVRLRQSLSFRSLAGCVIKRFVGGHRTLDFALAFAGLVLEGEESAFSFADVGLQVATANARRVAVDV